MIYLGVDIGGTNLKMGLVNRAGEMLVRQSAPTPTNLGDFSQAIRRLAIDVLEKSPERIAGVGVGCKGIVNPQTTAVEICPGTFSFLETQRLDELIRAIVPPGVPIFADNDARAALIGERLWGAARNARNALMFTLGTGLGGAVLAENRILRGASGVAGHLGHISIEPDGAPCICGSRGCLETAFSARALEARALEAVHLGCESILTERFAGNYAALTCFDVFAAAADGDPTAQTILGDAIRRLGAGIAGLLHVFDSEIVIVGGSIAQAGDRLFEPLRSEIRWRTHRWIRRSVPIVAPQAADSSGIAGAAGLALIASAEH